MSTRTQRLAAHLAAEELDEAQLQKIEAEMPKMSGKTWNGMSLREIGSSWGSVSGTFYDHTVLPGIRDIPYANGWNPSKTFYSKSDWDHSRELAEEIRINQEIEPLLVGIYTTDWEPFILEGIHRFVSLHLLGHSSFPARIVIGN